MFDASTHKIIATLVGNSFCGLGTYVEDVSRPYIDLGSAAGGNYDLKCVEDNYFSSSVARPGNGFLGVRGQPVVEARFNGTGAGPSLTVSSGRNISSVTKNSTGDYTVNFFRALPSATNRYAFSSQSASGTPITLYLFGESTTSVRVRAATSAGTLTDVDSICVMVFSDQYI